MGLHTFNHSSQEVEVGSLKSAWSTELVEKPKKGGRQKKGWRAIEMAHGLRGLAVCSLTGLMCALLSLKFEMLCETWFLT